MVLASMFLCVLFVCVCVLWLCLSVYDSFQIIFFWVFFLKREKNKIWRYGVGQLGRWERYGKKCSRGNCNQNILCDKNLFSIVIVGFITQNTDSHSKEETRGL